MAKPKAKPTKREQAEEARRVIEFAASLKREKEQRASVGSGEPFVDNYQELAQWLKPEAGQALSDHLYIVDPMGRWMMRTPVDPDPAKVKRDIERLLRASASWDRPGR